MEILLKIIGICIIICFLPGFAIGLLWSVASGEKFDALVFLIMILAGLGLIVGIIVI